MKPRQAALAGLLSGALFALGTGLVTNLVLGRGTFWSAVQQGDPSRLLESALAPVAGGIIFGTALALILARVGKTLSVPEGERPEWCRPDEVFLRQGAANHWRGAINYGGWLYLTDARLRFVPHRILQSQDPAEWLLEAVDEVRLTQTMKLIPNGLAIRLLDGSEERFVVQLSERDAFRDAIEDARSARLIGPPPAAPESE